MARISEIISVLFGAIGTILIFIGAITTQQGDIRGAGSAGMALFHFIVVVIAFPFLLVAIYRTDNIPTWFRNIIMVESILNAIFMLLASNALSGDKTMYYVSSVLELLPIILLYLRRSYIIPKFKKEIPVSA